MISEFSSWSYWYKLKYCNSEDLSPGNFGKLLKSFSIYQVSGLLEHEIYHLPIKLEETISANNSSFSSRCMCSMKSTCVS